MDRKDTGYSENSIGAWLLIALAVYLVRIMPWALAEYWYDEVLTLGEFVLDPRGKGLWGGVFRTYPIANNHILSTALYWIWVRVLNYNLGAEQMVRLPSLLFGAGTIAIVMCHWRKWLGGRIANIGGLLLAISPVFTAYAYQIRGYSMSIFLATTALSGALELVHGKSKSGFALTCASCLLLPLVIPSNILFLPVLCLALFLSSDNLRERLKMAVPPCVCGLLGVCYYFTIWTQFVKAAQEPAGWDSPWLVAGNLLLAVLAHALVLLALLFVRKAQPAEEPKEEPSPLAFPMPDIHNPLKHWPLALLLATVAIIGGMLLISKAGQAPYPRVFLVFLPAVTLAILLVSRKSSANTLSFPLVLVLVLVNGLLWEQVSTWLTNRALAKGVSPSNLLQQYYRGNSDLREAAMLFSKEQWMENSLLLTDEYDHPTLSFYWRLFGGHPRGVNSFNTIPKGFFNEWRGPKPRIWAVAKTPEAAARMFAHAGIASAEELLKKGSDGSEGNGMTVVAICGLRAIYVPNILPTQPIPRPKTRPDLNSKTI